MRGSLDDKSIYCVRLCVFPILFPLIPTGWIGNLHKPGGSQGVVAKMSKIESTVSHSSGLAPGGKNGDDLTPNKFGV